MIAFGTQLGGVTFTFLGHFLSRDPNLYSSRAPLIAFISVVTFFGLALVIWSLKHFVSNEELKGYQSKNEDIKEKIRVGFLDGFKVIISRPYVAGIFAIIFIYEAVTTILNFQMYSLAKKTFIDPGQLNKFIFDYALMVQALACIIALFGTSFFQRKFGIKFCLIAYPAILGLAIIFYTIYPTLNVVLFAVILSKALNYSFNQPTKESLYIPTSKEIKYKSKAWIDVFGARVAKTFGSGFYKAAGSLVGFTSMVTLGMIALWIILSDKVGKKFHKIVSKNELIH
ncbi:MAG: Npt1/Npt2 family nucleotide transporter [bacterium]